MGELGRRLIMLSLLLVTWSCSQETTQPAANQPPRPPDTAAVRDLAARPGEEESASTGDTQHAWAALLANTGRDIWHVLPVKTVLDIRDGFNCMLPESLKTGQWAYADLAPRYVWRIVARSGRQSVVVLEHSILGQLHPGSTRFRIHTFAPSGELLHTTKSNTAWRYYLCDAVVVQDAVRRLELIDVRASRFCIGPGGELPEDTMHQYYALCDAGVVMVRQEGPSGRTPAGSAAGGPQPLTRSFPEWEAALESGDLVETLQALSWLESTCAALEDAVRRGPTRSPPTQTASPVLDFIERPGIRQELLALSVSADPWLREAAVAVMGLLEHLRPSSSSGE